MKAPCIVMAALIGLSANPAVAQLGTTGGLGEVLVTANRNNARFAQQDRPVIGLRRQADAAVMQITISSDTREEASRKKEIHTVLLSALDRAAGAGLELVWGDYQLAPVTRANYATLPLEWAGRADTSKVVLLVKVRLAGSVTTAEKQLTNFIKAVPDYNRATLGQSGKLMLTIVDPDQYREQVVRLVAEDAKRNAGMFGPDFSFNITGIDGQIGWSQVSNSDVFLYLPYHYTIVPK